MDMFVDVFFLLDLLLRFLIGVVHKGSMITKISEVARHYLKTTFVLDCFASIPVAWIEYATIPPVDCDPHDHSNNAVKHLRLIRLIRMIRIFKVPPVLQLQTCLVRPPQTRPRPDPPHLQRAAGPRAPAAQRNPPHQGSLLGACRSRIHPSVPAFRRTPPSQGPTRPESKGRDGSSWGRPRDAA
jgi:hypothetical protein